MCKHKGKISTCSKFLLRWFFPWIIMFLIAPLVLPKFGYKLDLRKTVKLQAEKVGFGIKDSKPAVFLTQEYPAVEGISYRDSINLSINPALMIWQENEQPFWIGVQSNLEDKNYKNPTIFLDFKGKVNVRVEQKGSAGWVEMDPNFTYFIKLMGDIQPRTGFRINPLFVKFPEEGIYFVQYTIAGDDEIPTQGVFLIQAHKNIIVKNEFFRDLMKPLD